MKENAVTLEKLSTEPFFLNLARIVSPLQCFVTNAFPLGQHLKATWQTRVHFAAQSARKSPYVISIQIDIFHLCKIIYQTRIHT